MVGGLHVQASGAGFPDDQMWRWHTWTWEGHEGKRGQTEGKGRRLEIAYSPTLLPRARQAGCTEWNVQSGECSPKRF